ncbi:MAG: hypothetical protein RLZZ202_879 [Pseudomonadota bacterium]
MDYYEFSSIPMNLSKRFIHYLALALCSLFLIACQSTGKDGKPLTPAEIHQKRQATIKMAETGLNLLLKQDPKVRKYHECERHLGGGGARRGGSIRQAL